MNLNSIVQQLQAEQQHAGGKAQPPAARSTSGTTAPTTTATSGSNSSTSGATITADDFLTLLVSELQNQDPTADTDPNEYVNQLVNVNSLQQLISINQEVGTLTPPAASGTTPSSSVSAVTGTNTSSDPSAMQVASTNGYPATQSALQQFSPGQTAQLLPSQSAAAASQGVPGNVEIPASLRPAVNTY